MEMALRGRSKPAKKQEAKPAVAGSDRLRLGPVGDKPMFENFNYYSIGADPKEEGGLLQKMLKVFKGDRDYSKPVNPDQEKQEKELGEAVSLLKSIETGLGKITPSTTKLPSEDKEAMLERGMKRRLIREMIDLDNLPEIKEAAAKIRRDKKKARLKTVLNKEDPAGKSWKIELPPQEEEAFQEFWNSNKEVQQWKKEFRADYGEDPDIDTPIYDYRRAWKGGAAEWPERIKEDGKFHWGSAGKHITHPTYYKQFNREAVMQKLTDLEAAIGDPDDDSFEKTMQGLADIERETFERFPYPEDKPQMIQVYREIGKMYGEEIGVGSIPPERVHLLIYAEGLDPNFKKFFDGLGPESIEFN